MTPPTAAEFDALAVAALLDAGAPRRDRSGPRRELDIDSWDLGKALILLLKGML